MDTKKARLSDDATIYAKRDEKSEKQKWHELHGKEKWNYFRDYYLGKLLLIGACAALVIYLFVTILSPKPTRVLSVAVTDYMYLSETFDEMSTGFFDSLELDPEKFDVFIDNTFSLPSDTASVEKFSIYVFAGDIDVFIATEETFTSYANQGTLASLSSQLPSELFTKYSDRFLMTNILEKDLDGTVTDIGDTDAYGIYIDSLSCFKDFSYEGARPVIGIIANTDHAEYAVDFIEYLFRTYGAEE